MFRTAWRLPGRRLALLAGVVLLTLPAAPASLLSGNGPGDRHEADAAAQQDAASGRLFRLADNEADGGVPADSPACARLGCSVVETPGGVVKRLPQPAVEGMEHAKARTDNAGGVGNPPPGHATDNEAGGGVPADSPACARLGCSVVETPGGSVKRLPQPAVEGMEHAKANRDNAGGTGKPPPGHTTDDEADGGVPADSPACARLGCSVVETPGGVVKRLPQPAVEGMERAKAPRR